jgi:hypothetical protein
VSPSAATDESNGSATAVLRHGAELEAGARMAGHDRPGRWDTSAPRCSPDVLPSACEDMPRRWQASCRIEVSRQPDRATSKGEENENARCPWRTHAVGRPHRRLCPVDGTLVRTASPAT